MCSSLRRCPSYWFRSDRRVDDDRSCLASAATARRSRFSAIPQQRDAARHARKNVAKHLRTTGVARYSLQPLASGSRCRPSSPSIVPESSRAIGSSDPRRPGVRESVVLSSIQTTPPPDCSRQGSLPCLRVAASQNNPGVVKRFSASCRLHSPTESDRAAARRRGNCPSPSLGVLDHHCSIRPNHHDPVAPEGLQSARLELVTVPATSNAAPVEVRNAWDDMERSPNASSIDV